MQHSAFMLVTKGLSSTSCSSLSVHSRSGIQRIQVRANSSEVNSSLKAICCRRNLNLNLNNVGGATPPFLFVNHRSATKSLDNFA